MTVYIPLESYSKNALTKEPSVQQRTQHHVICPEQVDTLSPPKPPVAAILVMPHRERALGSRASCSHLVAS